MSEPQHFDVLVIGAGPAGIAAAAAAAGSGARVAMIDALAKPGGQIWRGSTSSPYGRARRWLDRLHRCNVRVYASTQVVDIPEPGMVLAESERGSILIAWSKLILAVGARELFLPFPGWTLPNVVGMGGLQALIKSGLDVRERRIVVAGSGPLLWASAAHALACGADITVIAEQAPGAAVRGFARGLFRHPRQLVDAARLRLELAGVPVRMGTWPVGAHGTARVREVELTDGQRVSTERCDYLACAFGLVGELELPMLAGCAIEADRVRVDEWQETSVAGIFCAGEATGIGGVDKALEEGLIAGYAATGRPDRARSRFARRARGRAFAGALARAFALRKELKALARDDTIVCRCEDIPKGQLQGLSSWREAKLFTRCGMGACQGRVCGSATRVLFGYGPNSARPPAFPARLESLAATNDTRQPSEGSRGAAWK